MGFEPIPPYGEQILSLPGLPIPPPERILWSCVDSNILTLVTQDNKNFYKNFTPSPPFVFMTTPEAGFQPV